MFRKLRSLIVDAALPIEERRRIDRAFKHLNSAGFDDWGADPETIRSGLAVFRWLYRDYFRVETAGMERIPAGRVLLVANHGGQIPIDAMMVGISLLLEAEPPRLARGMVERWAPSLPFVSAFFARCGQVTGDHRNARELLDADEAVLVFPEGVRGSGKTIGQKYQLQKFGTGFLRLALETKTPIVPVAVIGCEEAYPSFMNAEWIAKLFKAPYFPVTPTFPFFGLLGLLPLPAKVTLRYGKPLVFDGDPDASDAQVEAWVSQVKDALDEEIQLGLQRRGEQIFTGSAI